MHSRYERRPADAAIAGSPLCVMTRKPDQLWDMSAEQAAAHAMDNDLGGSFDQAQVQTRRPAKIVTALRLDLSVQAELEARRGHAESVRQR